MTAQLWFTADTHLGHAAMIKHSERPYANVEEMDESIISSWNTLVQPKDTVWHLGDVAFGGSARLVTYLRRLNGRLNICLGNHDKENMLRRAMQERGGCGELVDVKYLRLDGERFFLSHYAHRTWRKSHHGSFHLHGHSHGNLPRLNRSMDVGVDCWNFAPINLDLVFAELRGEPDTDHHPLNPSAHAYEPRDCGGACLTCGCGKAAHAQQG